MAVKAVLELGIPDIRAKAEGGKALSAPEIVTKLPTKVSPGPNSSGNLTCFMTPLVQEGLFSETLNEEKQPTYSLTEICKLYVKDHEWSVVPFSALHFSQIFVGPFFHLHEVSLDDEKVPFAAESGMLFFEYAEKTPQFRVPFDKAMTGRTRFELKDVVDNLQQTGWLERVQTFVDVGGGEGNVAGAHVVAHNPHIKGINFDVLGYLKMLMN